jgi:hypothetical protein
MLPAGTMPPFAIAAADIMDAAKLPAAMPYALKPKMLVAQNAVVTASTPPTAPPATYAYGMPEENMRGGDSPESWFGANLYFRDLKGLLFDRVCVFMFSGVSMNLQPIANLT